MSQNERVLVVPTELFHRLGHFQGFSTDTQRYMTQLLDPAHTSFRPRGEVEDDPSFKQLIPYVIFRHQSAGQATLFAYTRGAGQGEQRLHRKRSVGVGGHISADDVSDGADNPYEAGLRREVEEEVVVGVSCRRQLVGMINDDETSVGRVHLGVVHIFDVETPDVKPREAEIIESGFFPVDKLLADLQGFESWSQICLQSLFGQK